MESDTRGTAKWRMEIVDVDANGMFGGIVTKGRVNNGESK